MAPRPDLSWSGLQFDGHLIGPFKRPAVNGHLALTGFRAGATAIDSLTGDVAGRQGSVSVTGLATHVVLPGPDPQFLASAPVQLSVQALLDQAVPRVVFDIRHPLIDLNGNASFGKQVVSTTRLTIARLAPFAALAGTPLDGTAQFDTQITNANSVTKAKLSGTIHAAGDTILSRLLGNAQIAFSGSVGSNAINIDSASLHGAGLQMAGKGTQTADARQFNWSMTISDLSRLSPSAFGNMKIQGSLNGKPDDMTMQINARGDLASKGFPGAPIEANARAIGIPSHPSGEITAFGTLDAAPLRLAAKFTAAPRSPLRIVINNADWRSVSARGDFVLPYTQKGLGGHTELRIANLADIGLLTGAALKGSLNAAIAISTEKGRTAARLHADLAKAASGATQLGDTTIDGTVSDPLGRPTLALNAKASGLAAAGYKGDLVGTLSGPLDAIAANITSNLKDPAGNPARASAKAAIDTAKKRAVLSALNLNYRGDQFRLTAPSHFDFAGGFSVDRMQIASGRTAILIAGRFSPKLATTLVVRNATPDLVRPFVPSLNANGVFSLQAKLSGSTAAPTGTIVFNGTGLKLRGQSTVPAANIAARGALHGTGMRLAANIGAGPSQNLNVAGEVPLSANGRFDVKTTGTIDLTSFDPVLIASGKRLKGRATINGRFVGTLAQPQIEGTATLAGGDFQDFVQGFHIANLSATLQARGNTITVTNLTGTAGHGQIAGSGTISPWQPGVPVDVTLHMQHARPFTTDRLSADLNSDLKLVGSLGKGLSLTGSVLVGSGEVNIAQTFPPSVVVLDVRRKGTQPAPPLPNQAATTSPMKLDLKVSAPGGLYVRGRGLNAEVAGQINVKGTIGAPEVAGGFELRRGTLDVAGKSLDISKGLITFDGRSYKGSFDPALDFEASNASSGFVAKLAITGHASEPRITLSSSPSLPQDEVLSRLLFGENVSQLSPLELAQVAEGLSTLMGTGGGFNPLSSARRSLGLDRLAIGGTDKGNGATIEAGKSVSHGVYVGAKQDTTGGTQAMVQVDLTKHLKLQTTLSTGFGAQQSNTTIPTPQTDRGSSVGLSYQFEY
jgi:translocation and assembly module TamB